MLAVTRSISLLGLEGHVTDVEADLSAGLPRFTLLGVPDATLAEARDRVRSAIVNSGQQFPDRRITVALSPAWLPKRGSAFDVAVALSILGAQDERLRPHIEKLVSFGELGLDGQVRPVHGTLPAVATAKKLGFQRVVVPLANAKEAALVDGIEIVAIESLDQLLRVLLEGADPSPIPPMVHSTRPTSHDFEDVIGQIEVRRALEVAAVGRHHILMIGSPGSGKTMLAQRLTTILPPLTDEDALEVSAIHSIAGTLTPDSPLLNEPPFVAPHHTATRSAIIGGGLNSPRPGAVSMAHRGVLFIDEAPECASGVLDSLRQPLESGVVMISRAAGSALYPAAFSLVLAANPCPCGRYGSKVGCSCSPNSIRKYLGKLSGPLLDRIDIQIQVAPIGRVEFADPDPGETSATIRERVVAARARAHARWGSGPTTPTEMRREYPLEKQAQRWLHEQVDRAQLTARGMTKVARIAWSICDLRAGERPHMGDVQEALTLRRAAAGVLEA